MRYTVKVIVNKEIVNGFSCNEIHKAIEMESKLRQTHGFDNVWIVDSVQEIMVG